ncbi:putative F-box domain protein [Seiridium cardinale]|uniref:F-box domain protein n=1 Tax=Seiridium cardinale TaxID=138064 RepID=A0ABR2XFT0_9PEZI
MRIPTILLLTAALAAAREPTCPANNKIETTVPGSGYDALGTMKDVHEQLMACHNVKSLDLRVTLMGCSDWPDRWNFPFRLAGGDIHPNLTTLKLEGYEFSQSDWKDALPKGYSFNQLQMWINFYGLQKWYPLWRDTAAERRYMTNMQLWLEAMDWTKLESLTLTNNVDQCFFELATPHLTGLKSLQIHSDTSEARSAALQVITALPAETILTNLTWADSWSPEGFSRIIERHGETLQHLELYSKGPWSRKEDLALTISQLGMIASKMPKLQHLSLSMNRNGSWPWDNLAALAHIKSLVSTNIWLELQEDRMHDQPAHGGTLSNHDQGKDGDRFRCPALNVTSATHLFTYLIKENKGGNLQSVNLYIGDWNRPWDGPIYDPSWLEGRRGKVECSIMNSQGLKKTNGDGFCIHTVDEVAPGRLGDIYLDDFTDDWYGDQELEQLQLQMEL